MAGEATKRAGPRGAIPARAAAAANRFVGRDWIVGQIRDWAETGGERFLVVVGEPGWGKSTLAAWLVPDDPGGNVIARGRRPIELDAWHFCDSNLGQTVIAQAFSESLAAQLASRHPGYATAIVRRTAPEITVRIEAGQVSAPLIGISAETIVSSAKDARDVYDQLVRQPLAALAAEAGPPRPIFIVVDALDDALAGTPPTVVDLLAESLDFPAQVRFLVTTRAEERVVKRFPADETRLIYVSNPNDLGAIARDEADIREFVTKAMPAGAGRRRQASSSRARVVDGLVKAAAGNFLVAEFLLTELGSPGSQASLGGLYALYGRYLARIMPETTAAGISNRWEADYRPVLGALSVARPAAPNPVLPAWLEKGSGDVGEAITALGQVVEYLAQDGGSRRLYHRSLADFLWTPELESPLGPSPNRYFVEPREHHRRIADFYLRALKKTWAGDWRKSDAYGLSQLVRHLYELFLLTVNPAERAAVADELCGVALDRGYQAAQEGALGDASATIEACRMALEVSVGIGDPERLHERARQVASSREPRIRILGARVLRDLADRRPAAVMRELKRLAT
jgi:hypothetical protein